MTFLWIVGACLLALVWVLCIVDIFRRHYSAGTTFGWLFLVLLVPFIGALIYWAVRKPTKEESDQAYLADAARRQERAHKSFDGTGMGP